MITSDHGLQFTSNVWSQLCEMLNITHCQTIAYHPEANGAVERLHRRLKDALHAHAAPATWAKELPWVRLGLCAQPMADTDLSSLRQFLEFQLSCEKSFAWRRIFCDNISKNFLKTLDAPAFPLSNKHNSSPLLPEELPATPSSAPPLSGRAAVVASSLSSTRTTFPMLSCAGDPAPSPSE
jgi:hypothetical protein